MPVARKTRQGKANSKPVSAASTVSVLLQFLHILSSLGILDLATSTASSLLTARLALALKAVVRRLTDAPCRV